MRMERLPVPLSYPAAKAFRRYAQINDVDQCTVAKTAVTRYCRETPPMGELAEEDGKEKERVFISLPDTAMRLLELWSGNTGIPRAKLLAWAIRKLMEEEFKGECEE